MLPMGSGVGEGGSRVLLAWCSWSLVVADGVRCAGGGRGRASTQLWRSHWHFFDSPGWIDWSGESNRLDLSVWSWVYYVPGTVFTLRWAFAPLPPG
jgi:hypothetical protein